MKFKISVTCLSYGLLSDYVSRSGTHSHHSLCAVSQFSGVASKNKSKRKNSLKFQEITLKVRKMNFFICHF